MRREDGGLAETACTFRDLNEEIAAIARSLTDGGLPAFLCECGRSTCTEHVPATMDEYERVRAHGARFLVVLGHDLPRAEVVVARNERFAVVEKHAPAALRLALARDPRRPETPDRFSHRR